MSGGRQDEDGFETGLDVARRQRTFDEQRVETGRGMRLAEEDPTAGALVVRPELTIEQAKRAWNDVLVFKGVILEDDNCADDIGGTREMNRTGATRIALAFGLSIQERSVEESRVEPEDPAEGWDHRFRVRVRVSKGSRFVDGIASCRLSEIPARTKKGEPVPISQREHFALTKAWTRAAKRAIADILGGTEAEG